MLGNYLAQAIINNTITNDFDTVLVKEINQETAAVLLFVKHDDLSAVEKHYEVVELVDDFYTFSIVLITIQNNKLDIVWTTNY